MQEALAFRAENESLYALVSTLTDEELDTKTFFKEWTINEILRHLHVWNVAADITLRDSKEFMSFLGAVGKGMGPRGLRDFEVKHTEGLKGRKLVAAWHEGFIGVGERYGAADPTRRVKWGGPDMTTKDKIIARLMETWSHSQAIYDALGKVRRNQDHINLIALIGVKTFGFTFKNRQEKPPGPLPRLHLVAPSGQVWSFGEESQSERIEGLAEEFCQVVTQCRNIEDTQLKVIGSTAKEWMSKAQCFAGPPEQPPTAGLRRMVAQSKL